MSEAKPLDGITVVDLTRVLAGPFCTMVLRDLGAEVIKVEPPEGDEARGFGPFLPGAAGERGASSYYTSLNCGKRSVVLDLKRADGRAALAGLIRRADVLVENYRPGTLARLGFPPERLRQLNPRLVYAAVSGFGATGPAAQRPAYDMIIQAALGTDVDHRHRGAGRDSGRGAGAGGGTGRRGTWAGARSGREARAGVATGRRRAARAARPAGARRHLHCRHRQRPVRRHRHRGGAGAARADRSEPTSRGAIGTWACWTQCTVSVLENAIARYQVTGAVPGPLGTRHPSITPFETFATADRYDDEIVVAAGNDRLFATLCSVLGRDNLVGDPRFAGNAARTEHVAELKRELESALAQESSAAWLQRLAAAGVPAAPVNTVADLFDDPQLAARDMLLPVAGCDGLLVPGTPLKFAGVAAERARPPAPALGEHHRTGAGRTGRPPRGGRRTWAGGCLRRSGRRPSVAPRPPGHPAGRSPRRR